MGKIYDTLVRSRRELKKAPQQDKLFNDLFLKKGAQDLAARPPAEEPAAAPSRQASAAARLETPTVPENNPAVPEPPPPAPAQAAASAVAGTAHETDIITVKKGDTLIRIIASYYGQYSDELLQNVAANNPHIKNINYIHPGQQLKFPKKLAGNTPEHE